MPKQRKNKKGGKALEGACFSITGTMSMSRAALSTEIKAQGGAVAGSVAGKVTHPLSTEAEVQDKTLKVILAEGKGLPIVSEDFLDACKKAKQIVATKKYELSGGGAPAKKVAEKAAKKVIIERGSKEERAVKQRTVWPLILLSCLSPLLLLPAYFFGRRNLPNVRSNPYSCL